MARGTALTKRAARIASFPGRMFAVVALALAAPSARAADLARGTAFEGQNVVAIDVVGLENATPEQVRYRMSTRIGQPLRMDELDADYHRLLATELFDDLQFRPLQPVPGGVRLVVSVREKGLVRRIDFVGNDFVSTKRVRRKIKLKVGERFDLGKANVDRRAIEDYYHDEFYYFASVEVRTEPFEDGVRVVFDIDEGGKLVVADVSFRGNVQFTDKELRTRAQMETKPSSILNRGKYIRRAFEVDLLKIRQLYESRGYLDVRVTERPMQITTNEVETRRQKRHVYLHIDIDEGPQYRVGRIDIQGNRLISEELIRTNLNVLPGDVFNLQQVLEDCEAIRDAYGTYPNSRYFTKVRPEPVITEEGAVQDLLIRIEESPPITFEGIRIAIEGRDGHERYTKDNVIVREFEMFPGEEVDSRKFKHSAVNLNRLAYFKSLKNDGTLVTLREGSAPDRAVAVVEGQEDRTGRASIGIATSSSEAISGTVGITQRNFDFTDFPKSWKDFFTGQSLRGAGQSFSVNLTRGSEHDDYSMHFWNPWIFGRPISFGLDVFYTKDYWDEYEERRYGFGLTFGKRLFDNPRLNGSIGYRMEFVKNAKITDLYEYAGLLDTKSHRIARYILNLTYDSRDSRFDPTRGAMLSGTGEIAGTPAGGTEDFWRAFLDGQMYIPLFEDKEKRPWTLALRGEVSWAGGWGGDDVPYYERFFAGGPGSVLGWERRTITPRYSDVHGATGYEDLDELEMGGEGRAVAGAEFFVPLYQRIIKASAFYNLGTVWYKRGDSPEHWRQSYGIGLHIKTPLGPAPVRLYYSWIKNSYGHDDTKRFDFTFGALF